MLIRLLFFIAAAYDGILGVAFLAFGPAVFDAFEVTPPNHWGYVHFPAALLIVFAVMFLTIAVRPRPRRDLIPYGIGLKVSYCAVAGYHWAAAGIPWMWQPFVILDLAFLVLFAWAYVVLGRAKAA